MAPTSKGVSFLPGPPQGDGARASLKPPTTGPASSRRVPAAPRLLIKGSSSVNSSDVRDSLSSRTTKKVEKWFELNGRPRMGRKCREGRQWIQAITCGRQRQKQHGEEVKFTGLFSEGEKSVEVEASSIAERLRQRRVAAAREPEERLWRAHHRNGGGMRPVVAASAVSSPLALALGGSLVEGDHGDGAAGARELALWVPMGEAEAGVRQLSRPQSAQAQSGVRQRSRPTSAQAQPGVRQRSRPASAQSGGLREQRSRPASAQAGGARPQPSDAGGMAMRGALGLWRSLNAGG